MSYRYTPEEIGELNEKIDRLRAATQALVTKMTEIEADESFRGIWPFLQAHGYKYLGPDWRDALADARTALSQLA